MDDLRERRLTAAHDAIQEQIGWRGQRDEVRERAAAILDAADRVAPVDDYLRALGHIATRAAAGAGGARAMQLIARSVLGLDLNDVGLPEETP